MTKPAALRKPDVHSKLAYATHRHQELMSALFEAKKAARDPAFLVHTCADIIATVRECFDYLSKDIIECHIIAGTKNQRRMREQAANNLRAYFPYYDSQVSRSDSVFHELTTIEPPLYQALLDFTASIASGAPIPDTLFTYKELVDVKDMVNEKKHDKLIGIVSEADREYLIENDAMKLLLPMKDQKGWSSFAVAPGTQVSRVTEYRFAHNNQEVGKFCLFATKATERVIGEFYQAYFA